MENARVSHYELRHLLGRGGMGEVYEAFDLKAKRPVALKFVAPELAAEPEAFRRFESEALNAAALNHPHIATLYEFEPEGERPFIAMELVAGPSLRDRITAGPLGLQESLEVARDVAAALAYAHRRGIVHRDIKPENLMFDEEGRIKVMDFGLARALMASRLTLTGSSLGTPSYMSPESAQQGSAGTPSDVFALGLVLSEMLTGQQTFHGDSPLAVMYAIVNAAPPPLRQQRPDASEALEALVARLLAKDPERRPDAAGAARELAALSGARVSQLDLGASDSGTAPATASGAEVAATAVSGAQAGERRGPRASAMRAAWSVTVSLAIVAIAAGLWMTRSAATRRARRQEAVVLNNQAHAALQNNDLIQAERLVLLALDRDPQFGEALFNRAVIYSGRGELDSAATLYGALIRSHARDTALVAMALYNLGDIDLRSGAPGQAVDHLARSFALDSSRWESYNNLGFALVQARRPADAVALLARGTSRFAGAAPLYKNAALALSALDRDAEALVQLDRALVRDPHLASALALRARLRARRGDRAGALADWELYTHSDPPPDPGERADLERELATRGVAIPAHR